MKLQKKYAIKRKFDKQTNKFKYYPVHSYFELIWSYFEEDTGKTVDLIGPWGLHTLQPVTRTICFDDLEDAKAYIGKLIWDKKTEEERKDIIIQIAKEELENETKLD